MNGRKFLGVIAALTVAMLSFAAPALADKGGVPNGGNGNGNGGHNCPNPAGKYPPGQCKQVSLSSNAVERGSTVEVNGDGFSPNSPVQVFLGSGESLGTVVTDANGAFSSKLAVPANATVGAGQVTVKGADGVGAPLALSSDVNILAQPAAATTSPGGGDGSSVALLAVAAGLVALGGAALVAARRRRAGAVSGW